MKLRNLTGAIRRTTGAVMLTIPAADGKLVEVGLVKSMFIDGLKAAFGDDSQAETGMDVDENGRLTVGVSSAEYVAAYDATATTQGTLCDDLDLLAEGPDTTLHFESVEIEDLLSGGALCRPVSLSSPTLAVEEIEDLLA